MSVPSLFASDVAVCAVVCIWAATAHQRLRQSQATASSAGAGAGQGCKATTRRALLLSLTLASFTSSAVGTGILAPRPQIEGLVGVNASYVVEL